MARKTKSYQDIINQAARIRMRNLDKLNSPRLRKVTEIEGRYLDNIKNTRKFQNEVTKAQKRADATPDRIKALDIEDEGRYYSRHTQIPRATYMGLASSNG